MNHLWTFLISQFKLQKYKAWSALFESETKMIFKLNIKTFCTVFFPNFALKNTSPKAFISVEEKSRVIKIKMWRVSGQNQKIKCICKK